ncbi:MAG: hypothetical protein BRD55_00195 [Bacteroidetes bacterium SW_9_63_38]|nr:MAG: hypothetical protein BRD55_00195 [Bacteroidetes bacterium SW_9_63_38]
MIRTGIFIALLVLLGVGMGGEAYAQRIGPAASDSRVQQGRSVLTDWPASLPRLLDEMGRKAPSLLPELDSLALDYRYVAGDSTSRWAFTLAWRPGDRVLHEGEVLPRRRAPRGLRMVNVELRAEVHADGEYVGDMIVAIDSMALTPSPSTYPFQVTVPHDRVFLDTPASTARRALRQGVRLRNLVVERVEFTAATEGRSERRRDSEGQARSDPSVYTTARILVGWRVGPDPYYVDREDETRTTARRDETEARSPPTERSGEATAEGDAQNEDTSSGEEDDDTSLRLPALGAAAAVGLVAVAGGTVGLYGRGDTPIGLAAGYTHAKGGVQLHAAVNSAVIEDGRNQKLTVKAFGFYDVFSSHIQPAAGVGVQISPARRREVQPAVSFGMAANWERVVLFGGVDVVQGTPEVGLTYNFRYQADREQKQEAPR